MCEKRTYKHWQSACDRFATAHMAADVAKKAGMRAQVLSNALNPNQPHRLTVHDLIAIYQVTGDSTLIDGLLMECGYAAIRIEPSSDESPIAIRAMNATATVAGVTARAVQVLDGRRRISKPTRNAAVGGLMAGMRELMRLAVDIEARFSATPVISITADLAARVTIA